MNPLRAKELVIDIPDRGDGQPLDFTVEPGQMWGVLGPNGAGKTTLLHTLAGLRAPRHGAVCLGEHALTNSGASGFHNNWGWYSRSGRTVFRPR